MRVAVRGWLLRCFRSRRMISRGQQRVEYTAVPPLSSRAAGQRTQGTDWAKGRAGETRCVL